MYFFDSREERNQDICLQTDTAGVITYGDLDVFCESMGDVLCPRTLVFLLCSNTAGSVCGYFACLRMRAVPLLLDAETDAGMVRKLVELYDPEYLYVPQEKHVWEKEGEICFASHGYELVKRQKDSKTVLHEDLALLMTTSGSTGSPKLIRQSYANIQANAESIAEYLKLDRQERPITTLPMHYTYGLSVIHSHVLAGARILLTQYSLFEQEFWDFFRSGGATSLAGVPFTYEMLKRIGFLRMELPSLKTMTQAGGKLSLPLQKEFASYAAQNGKQFVIMYGQTEATARMSYLPPQDALRKCGSIGIPIPGGRFRIVDDELIYEGRNVTLGYAGKKEDLARGDDNHGILYTGDLAKKDEEGYYYIIGRKNRFLKLFGKRINLDEVEQILRAQYTDMSFACVGTDDHLSVYMESGEQDMEGMRTFLSRKLRLNASVIRMHVIRQIPVSDSGKIQYKKLEERECHMD